MKPASPRTVARYAVVVAILAAAQNGAPLFSNQASGEVQSTAPAQSRTQKLSNPLNDLLDEAQHDIDKNDFESAIPPLQKFLAEKPDVAYAHFQLAYAYTALKRIPEARAEYERTIALDPSMSEAHLNLGILLTENGEPAAAVAPLRKAVELLPAQSRPRILLGIAQERSGDSPGAADSFEGAVRLDPRDTEAALHLAKLYLSLKRPVDAEKRFREVLEVHPTSATAALGLAQTLDAQGKPEAVDAYRKYLSLQPSDSAARARLVHFLVEQKNNDEALAELDRAEAGKPTADSLRLRADIQIAQKKYDDAIATLHRALVLTPNDAQLIGGLGRIYMQKHDYASAERELKIAMQLDPQNVAYWKDLSSSYYLSGDCVSTLASLDVIAKAEPPAAGSWFIRALCYDKLHQIKPALEAYQKFLAMDEGKNPDQIWQAQQRSAVLKHQLEAKGK